MLGVQPLLECFRHWTFDDARGRVFVRSGVALWVLLLVLLLAFFSGRGRGCLKEKEGI